MGHFWGVFFLLGLATAVPLVPPKNFQEALSQAVTVYNQGPKIQNAFRVLEAMPGVNSSSLKVQQLKFTLQETVCPTSKKILTEECEFKPDGLVKDCSGYFSTEQPNSMVVITCDTSVQEPVRVTRFGPLGILLRGLRTGFKLWGSNQ